MHCTYQTYRFDPLSSESEHGRWNPLSIQHVPIYPSPQPALSLGPSHLIILGSSIQTPIHTTDQHEPDQILTYHTITDTWTTLDQISGSNAVAWTKWQNGIAMAVEPDSSKSSLEMYLANPKTISGQFHLMDYLTWGLYLFSLILIGFYFSKREKSTRDFFLGGQRVYWWAAGISIFGTQLSAITFMAIPAKVYATNWIYILAQATIILIAPVIVFLHLPYFRKMNLISAYTYLERRFSTNTQRIGSLVFCFLQLGRIGIVLFLPAIALSTVTDIPITVCILAMGILCTIYTVLGGIEAVIWTDVLQVFVLMGGALFCLLTMILHIDGGFSEVIRLGHEADKFQIFDLRWDMTATVVWVVVLGNLFSNLVPYSADQTVIQRYLTTPSQKQAAGAIWTNAILVIPASLIFFSLGTALYAFYKTSPGLLHPGMNTDAILPWFIAQELPVGVAGILLAAVFAAAMSSLDSSLNSMATVLVTDFYHHFRPQSKDEHKLRVARIITIILGCFGTISAILLASFPIQSLWDLFLALLGLLGGGLAGLFLLGMITKTANSVGAQIGFFTSGIILLYVRTFTSTHFFLYAPIGILSCLIIGYVMSIPFRLSYQR
jgi:SSS family transporter